MHKLATFPSSVATANRVFTELPNMLPVKAKGVMLFSFLVFCLFFSNGQAQEMLHDVITDYTTLRQNNKVVKVTLPENSSTVFYRITIFKTTKVNTYDSFHESIRPVNPDLLKSKDYDFKKHLLENNIAAGVNVVFMETEKEAENFKNNKETTAFQKIDGVLQTAGRLENTKVKEVFVGFKPIKKNTPIIVKLEMLAYAPVKINDANDKYPFSIQNEVDTTIAYEISGNRRDWEVFYLPKRKKAEFKLAEPSVYFRVSTVVKTSEEYMIESGKKYRIYWNKDGSKVDLGELK